MYLPNTIATEWMAIIEKRTLDKTLFLFCNIKITNSVKQKHKNKHLQKSTLTNFIFIFADV